MQLRTKLFLWIGGLFLIAFILSFALENHLTTKFINGVRTAWENYVLTSNEEKRKSIQEFIGVAIAEKIAEIDAKLRAVVLKGIQSFSFSTTLINDPSLSFLQFHQNKTWHYYSRPKEVWLAQIVPIDDRYGWLFYKKRDESLSWEGPVRAVKMVNHVDERRGDLFVIFNPSFPLPEEFKEAEAAFKNAPTPTLGLSEKEDIQNLCLNSSSRPIKEDIQSFFLRSDQNYLSGYLYNYFSWEGVIGTALISQNAKIGDLVFKKEAFTTSQLFDDESYFKSHFSPPPCLPVGNYLSLISVDDGKRCFLGNTALVNEAYVTIGIDPVELLRLLALSTNKMALLMRDSKIIDGIDAKGASLPSLDLFQHANFFTKDIGLVDVDSTSYFYMKMTPVTNIDLHFLLLIPESEEFSLVHTITEEAKKVISKMSLDMHIVVILGICFALFGLHRIASRITKPIDKLVVATQEVGKGHLEGFDIPVKSHSRDEIDILCASFAKMVQELRDKEKVRDVLNKVVSEEIAQEILKGNIHLGGEEKVVTLLFGDIRSFTQLTEKMNPAEVIEFLNTCMTKVSEIIDKNGGVIDKYIGDAVMALFGAPVSIDNAPLRAVECALKMRQELDDWNRERTLKGLPKIEMGIGIHTGPVIVGNMGGKDRLNYTAIGANVNLAARLCSAALPQQILITKETKEALPDTILLRPLEPMKLRGFSQTIEVFEITGLKNAN